MTWGVIVPDDRFIHRRCGHSEKVSGLTDFEFRVWTQYLMSADDFGVMRSSAVTLQADNDSLNERPAKAVQKALDALVKVGLVREFAHQSRTYLFQNDWQSWQKVSYPRKTNQPKPPAELIDACDRHTQLLFDLHPGGNRKKFSLGSSVVSGTNQEDIPTTRAGAPAKRLTANGYGLQVGGGAGEPPPPPFDVWFGELQRAYPPAAVSGGLLTMQAFTAVFLERETGRAPVAVWAEMRANLATQQAGAQWRDGKIPRLDRWLSADLWKQRHETPAEAARLAVVQSKPWVCPHVDECGNPNMCESRLTSPWRYPLRASEAHA